MKQNCKFVCVQIMETCVLSELWKLESVTDLELPLAGVGISAGFPSPAQDFSDKGIDLNKELIRHPSSTFFGRVMGESMRDAGISDGDLLVVDKSVKPSDGSVAVCFIDGEFTVKRVRIEYDGIWLMPANQAYKPFKVTEEHHFVIWGVVIHVIKSF